MKNYVCFIFCLSSAGGQTNKKSVDNSWQPNIYRLACKMPFTVKWTKKRKLIFIFIGFFKNYVQPYSYPCPQSTLKGLIWCGFFYFGLGNYKLIWECIGGSCWCCTVFLIPLALCIKQDIGSWIWSLYWIFNWNSINSLDFLYFYNEEQFFLQFFVSLLK